MHCRDFLDLYSAYRDGADPVVVGAMEAHMATCDSCRTHDRAVRQGVDALRGHLVLPSPEFERRLQERLESGGRVEELFPPRVAPLTATAMVLLALVLLALAVRRPPVVATAAAEEEPALLARPRALAGIPFVAFVPAP